MNRQFVKRLKEYTRAKSLLTTALKELETKRAESRHFLRAENQRREYCNYLTSIGVTEDIYNNEMIPWTRMRISEIRKSRAKDCKQAKLKVKECQIELNRCFERLKEYVI